MTPPDRRVLKRLPAGEVAVTLRLGYRLGRVPAVVLDFNRHGMAVRTEQPLPSHGTVDLALECRSVRITGVVAVIHNCRVLGDGGYRCGLQFRTDDRTQLDRVHIRQALTRLEETLASLGLEPCTDDALSAT